MIRIIIIFIVVITTTAFGQKSDDMVSILQKQTVYRNVKNIIVVHSLSDSINYRIKCTGCDTIFRHEKTDTITITSSRAREIQISIFKSNVFDEIYYQKTMSVSYLPSPKLLLGDTESGLNYNKEANRLFLEYPSWICSSVIPELLSWEVYIGNNLFEGKGCNLSNEVKEYLLRKDSKSIGVVARIKGGDGIVKIIAGFYPNPK